MHLSKPYPHDYRRPADAEALLQASLEAAYQKLEAKGFSKQDIAIGFLDEASPQTTTNDPIKRINLYFNFKYINTDSS